MGVPAKHSSFALFALGVFALDRGSKAWASAEIPLGDRLDVIEGFFYFVHVRNPGAAFGLFADAAPELKAIAFSLAAALALLVIVLHLQTLAPRDRRVAAALGMVSGGAVGNLVDRLPMLGGGEVIDFLHIDLWAGYPWPDFNIADVAIVLGVAGLIVDMVARESAARASGIDVDESRA